MTPEPGTALPTPLAQSQAFIDAYNRRDADALRALLAPDLEYVRPGPVTLTTTDEVMAQYEMDWSRFERSRVDIRSFVEADDTVAAEVTISASERGREAVVEAVVIHQWRNGRLIRYRAYFDPFPNL
ncbi:MAG: nuclear transport factor 2 family protein [Desulfobacterales bacterium]|nr:nuclear transport factor 2 family protein [Desulfobacterales bacterium]